MGHSGPGIESLSHEYGFFEAKSLHMHSPYSDPNIGGFYKGPLIAPHIAKPEWMKADEWKT